MACPPSPSNFHHKVNNAVELASPVVEQNCGPVEGELCFEMMNLGEPQCPPNVGEGPCCENSVQTSGHNRRPVPRELCCEMMYLGQPRRLTNLGESPCCENLIQTSEQNC